VSHFYKHTVTVFPAINEIFEYKRVKVNVFILEKIVFIVCQH